MCKVLERTISRYVTYSRVLWVLYIIHRKDWQVNKVARDRDSDYCGIAVRFGFGGSRNAVLQEARREVWVGGKNLKKSHD